MRYLAEYKKYNIPEQPDYILDINDILKDVDQISFERIMKSLKGCPISFECERAYDPPDFKDDHSCWYYKKIKAVPTGLYKLTKAIHYGVVEDINVSFKKSHHTGRYSFRKQKGVRVLIKFEGVGRYHRLDDIFKIYCEPKNELKIHLTSKRFDL